MTSKEIQLKTSTQKHSIIEDIEGVLVETEMALNRIFQKNQDSGLDSNLLRRLIYTHLSRSQDSLIVLSKIIEAHQKGILDNVLIASLGVTS